MIVKLIVKCEARAARCTRALVQSWHHQKEREQRHARKASLKCDARLPQYTQALVRSSRRKCEDQQKDARQISFKCEARMPRWPKALVQSSHHKPEHKQRQHSQRSLVHPISNTQLMQEVSRCSENKSAKRIFHYGQKPWCIVHLRNGRTNQKNSG